MERHHIDEHAAFLMLRQEARRSRRKLVDLAEAILSGHRLLTDDGTSGRPDAGTDDPGG